MLLDSIQFLYTQVPFCYQVCTGPAIPTCPLPITHPSSARPRLSTLPGLTPFYSGSIHTTPSHPFLAAHQSSAYPSTVLALPALGTRPPGYHQSAVGKVNPLQRITPLSAHHKVVKKNSKKRTDKRDKHVRF